MTEREGEHVGRSALSFLQEMLTFHPEVELMLEQLQVLADSQSSSAELLHALEELEYHAHQIANARALDSIGGLVLVVRLLNHSDIFVVVPAVLRKVANCATAVAFSCLLAFSFSFLWAFPTPLICPTRIAHS